MLNQVAFEINCCLIEYYRIKELEEAISYFLPLFSKFSVKNHFPLEISLCYCI